MYSLTQAGAIPYRVREGEDFEFLLVTSRRGNWIFPKGIVEPGETAEETAAKECREEAGVRGQVLPRSVGSYRVRKWRRDCDVHLFLMRWEEDIEWEEADIRERMWCSYDEARERLKNDALRDLLRLAAERLPARADLSGRRSSCSSWRSGRASPTHVGGSPDRSPRG